jgi:hypothetical protein
MYYPFPGVWKFSVLGVFLCNHWASVPHRGFLFLYSNIKFSRKKVNHRRQQSVFSDKYQDINIFVTESHIKGFIFRTSALSAAACLVYERFWPLERSSKLSRLSLFANTKSTCFYIAFGGTHPWVQIFVWWMAFYIGMFSQKLEG